MRWGWGFWVLQLIIKQRSLKMTGINELCTVVAFQDSADLWFSASAPEFHEAGEAAHSRARRAVAWDAQAGPGRGEDENNSKGEGSDPSPHRTLILVHRDKASVPSILSPQLMPHSPPEASHLPPLSKGLRWRGSPLTPSWPHCFTLQLSHPQPQA